MDLVDENTVNPVIFWIGKKESKLSGVLSGKLARNFTRLSGPEGQPEKCSPAFLARMTISKVHPPFWPGGPARKFTRLSGPEGQPES
jgi:hypothetical protein